MSDAVDTKPGGAELGVFGCGLSDPEVGHRAGLLSER